MSKHLKIEITPSFQRLSLSKIILIIIGIFAVVFVITYLSKPQVSIEQGKTTFSNEELYDATLSSYQQFPDGFYKGKKGSQMHSIGIFSNWLELGSCATSKEDAEERLRAFESRQDYAPLVWSSLKITEYPEFYELNYNRNHSNSNQSSFMFKCDMISVKKIPAYGGSYSGEVIGTIPGPITQEKAKHITEFFAFYQGQHETHKVLSELESENETEYTFTLYRTNFTSNKPEIQRCKTVYLTKSEFHVNKITGVLSLDESLVQKVSEDQLNSSVTCK